MKLLKLRESYSSCFKVVVSLPWSVPKSNTSKPLDLKYASACSHEMDGDGRSTDAALDVIPSLRPVKTG